MLPIETLRGPSQNVHGVTYICHTEIELGHIVTDPTLARELS